MDAENSFNNRIEWIIDPQSMATDTEAQDIERKIITAIPTLSDSEKSFLPEFSVLMSCTREIKATWKGGESPALIAFVDTFEKRKELTPEELWKWRYNLPYAIRDAWLDEFKRSRKLYKTDPAQLPTNMLSLQDQEELKDKKSPLPNPDENSQEN